MPGSPQAYRLFGAFAALLIATACGGEDGTTGGLFSIV
jgi:hypothetical protein